jgi:glycosyltransferase involved in cell wall biosynthesis
MPAISVVVPNYNHAQLLPRCLDAILAQSLPPLELIVIDDASTDESLEVIERYARANPVIRVVRNAANQGVIAGMNQGLALARGDCVLFAASDDHLLPGFLEKSAALLERHPAAALCCSIGDWHEVQSGLQLRVGAGMGGRAAYLAPAECEALEASGRFYVASHTALMRKAALLAAGGFDPGLRWHADWFTINVIAFRHGVCFVPEALARFFIYPVSYYKSGAAGASHRAVLERLLERLAEPACADVEPALRRSGALYLFGWPLLRILLARHRRYLNATFLRKNLWYVVTRGLKPFLPRALAQWYLRKASLQ